MTATHLGGAITLTGVEKWFEQFQVIRGVDLSINAGEFVIFVGPSGCGKSTLLRMIAGLEDTSRGDIIIDDRHVTGLPPAERNLSMVFQSYALYPHMTVQDNMGFGLKTAGASAADIRTKVDEAARLLQLTDYLERFPKALSGGQRQRVAIGRSIVRQPVAFLFDEPLSNLDAALRIGMRFEIAKLHRALGATMIYVTHDQVEAMTLAERIVVLRDGRIEQVGTPRELYEQPANLFVAQFIGSPRMNILPCRADQHVFYLEGHGSGKIVNDTANASPGELSHGKDRDTIKHLGVRPEHIHVVDTGAGHCSGTIDIAEYLGADTILYVDVDQLGPVTVRIVGDSRFRSGDRVDLEFTEQRCRFFDGDGNAVPV